MLYTICHLPRLCFETMQLLMTSGLDGFVFLLVGQLGACLHGSLHLAHAVQPTYTIIRIIDPIVSCFAVKLHGYHSHSKRPNLVNHHVFLCIDDFISRLVVISMISMITPHWGLRCCRSCMSLNRSMLVLRIFPVHCMGPLLGRSVGPDDFFV